MIISKIYCNLAGDVITVLNGLDIYHKNYQLKWSKNKFLHVVRNQRHVNRYVFNKCKYELISLVFNATRITTIIFNDLYSTINFTNTRDCGYKLADMETCNVFILFIAYIAID